MSNRQMNQLSSQQSEQSNHIHQAPSLYQKSQFLNLPQLARDILSQAWKSTLCDLCGLVAQNPRLCQSCEALACFECIARYQNETVKDPSKCFKGCQFIVFQPLTRREKEYVSYFQGIVDSLEHADFNRHQLFNQGGKLEIKNPLVGNGPISPVQVAGGGAQFKFVKKDQGSKKDGKEGEQVNMRLGSSDSVKDAHKVFDYLLHNMNMQPLINQQNDQKGLAAKGGQSEETCVLCLKQIASADRQTHVKECMSAFKYCDNCRGFTLKADPSHQCGGDLQSVFQGIGGSSQVSVDSLKVIMLQMQKQFQDRIDNLQNDNKDLKNRLKKRDEVNFCSGCERIVGKSDKKVRCSNCDEEYCFKCTGTKLFYCYICMGYVCCEEMKLAQLCDAHITKSKEKFGQLFQIECPSPRLSEKGGAAQSGNVSNPEIEQTFNPMNGENF